MWQLGSRGKNAGHEMRELFREILPFACTSETGEHRKPMNTAVESKIPEIEHI